MDGMIISFIPKVDSKKQYDGNNCGITKFPIYNKQRAFIRVDEE